MRHIFDTYATICVKQYVTFGYLYVSQLCHAGYMCHIIVVIYVIKCVTMLHIHVSHIVTVANMCHTCHKNASHVS
jgi:hypothetical protein